MLRTPTNNAAPMIDHTTGKASRPIGILKISGRCRCRASHIPNSAPMKPSAIEPRHPVFL